MIEFRDVSYAYGRDALLTGMNVVLEPGSFHFLTGPSGAGKTTFLKLCYGALLASAGEITLFGDNVGELDRDAVAQLRRRVGVVHQDSQFIDHLSLVDNVALPLQVSGIPESDQTRADLLELMAWVGLTERAKALPQELSGGERQRAALARALILSPDLVLADEPTGNVDWEMSQRLLLLLVELNRMGKTILVATHDLSLIRAASKSGTKATVLRIAHGTLQQAGASL